MTSSNSKPKIKKWVIAFYRFRFRSCCTV